MKKVLFLSFAVIFISACNDSGEKTATTKMVDVTDTLKQVQVSSSVIYLKCKDTRTNRLSPTYTIYP